MKHNDGPKHPLFLPNSTDLKTTGLGLGLNRGTHTGYEYQELGITGLTVEFCHKHTVLAYFILLLPVSFCKFCLFIKF